MPKCEHCSDGADLLVRLTDGRMLFVCPNCAKRYVPVGSPPWYGNKPPPKIEGVESVDFIPEQE